jgi:hypothetical protein
MIFNKLLIQKFESSIKRGTGEAFIIIKDYPNIDFTDSIIKVAVKNYAYDRQAEGSRASYVYELIRLNKEKKIIREAVLNRLKTENKDNWSLLQLFDLAKFFAESGDLEAKNCIYERFFTNCIVGSIDEGKDHILELDGLNGLQFVINKIGKYIEVNPDYFEDNTLISSFQKSNPNLPVNEELERLSKENKYIELYLNHVRKCESRKFKSVKLNQQFDIDTLTKKIANSERIINIKRYVDHLNQSDFIHLANLFKNEKKIAKKLEYLKIFSYIKFPGNINSLLKFARRKESKHHLLRDYALEALSNIKSPRIRKLALRKISNSKNCLPFIILFNSNYIDGDEKILTLIVRRTFREDDIEFLSSALTELYTLNKTKECLFPLLEIYNKSNCGIHRNSIINILIENNVLPQHIYNEIEYDSYNETRQLWQNLQNDV